MPFLVNPFIFATDDDGPILGWSKASEAANYATTTTVGTSWNPFSLTASANQVIRVEIAVDNIASLQTPDFTLDKPAGETNSWIEVVKHARLTTEGTTQRVGIFAIRTSVAWSAHSLNISLSASRTNAIANWQVWDGGSTLRRQVPQLAASGLVQTASTSQSLTGLTAPWSSDVLFAVAASDTISVPSLDSDTTNGSWENSGNSAGGQTGLTNTTLQMRSQHKLVTAFGDQTFDPTGADAVPVVALVPAGGIALVWEAATGGFSGTYPIFTLSDANTPLESGDLMVGIAALKQYNAVVPTPSGWTVGASGVSGSTTAAGNDTGSVLAKGYHKVSDGTEPATISLEPTSGSYVGFGRVARFRIAEQEYAQKDYSVASYELIDSDSTGTTVVGVAQTTPDIVAGDVLYVAMGIRTDATLTAEAMTVPGCTGLFVPFTQASTTVNADIRVAAGLFYVETGVCSSAPSWTGTISSAGFSEGAGILYRVRVVDA